MPRVSVITPTYNRAHLVHEAIDSVLCQTFGDFELIVIDDGSTDKTEEVISAIPDPRLKYRKRSNGGASAARNTGLEMATGEFVAFLDSDDLYLPRRLELQMAKVSEEPDAGLVYGRYYGTIATRTERKLVGRCYESLDLRRLIMGPAFHWSTVLIRRSYIEEVGGFDERFVVGEEWELTMRLALAGCRMVCVSEPLSIVRMQPVSLSRDIHKHISSSQGVLDKTFGNRHFPQALYPLQDTAYAAQLAMTAASAYLTPLPEVGRDFLVQALARDPSLARENMDLLVSKMFSFIFGLSLDDPEQTLRRIMPYLPGNQGFRRRLKRKLWERYYTDAAFLAHRARQPARCRNYVLKAIANNPTCLRNRGLVSILFRSLLGDRSRDQAEKGAGEYC